MRIHPRLISILLLSALPLCAAELPVVTLEEALTAAEENSIQLEEAAVRLNQAIRRQDAVLTTYMPTLSLSASVSTDVPFQDIGGNPPGYSGLSYSLGANASFTFDGSMIKDRENRRLAKEGASLEYQTTRSGFEGTIIEGYWGLAAADLSIESARIAAEDAQRQYDSALEMYRRGMMDELTLYQTELALQQAELQLKTLENSRDELMEAFKDSTGIEEDFRTEELPEPVLLALPAPAEIFSEFSENTLAIRRARNALESARTTESDARLSLYVPTLTASVRYSYGGRHDRAWNYATTANGLNGSISVSLPVSSLLPSSAADIQIKEAEDAVSLASLALQDANDSLLSEIRSYSMRIGQAEDTLRMAARTESTAAKTYELAQESFNAGLMSANDLASARSSQLSAEMSLLSSRLDHLLASYDLSYAINISLSDLQQRYAYTEENQ